MAVLIFSFGALAQQENPPKKEKVPTVPVKPKDDNKNPDRNNDNRERPRDDNKNKENPKKPDEK